MPALWRSSLVLPLPLDETKRRLRQLVDQVISAPAGAGLIRTYAGTLQESGEFQIRGPYYGLRSWIVTTEVRLEPDTDGTRLWLASAPDWTKTSFLVGFVLFFVLLPLISGHLRQLSLLPLPILAAGTFLGFHLIVETRRIKEMLQQQILYGSLMRR